MFEEGVVVVHDLLSRIASLTARGVPGSPPSAGRPPERDKWLAGGASLLMIGAVLLPVARHWQEHPRDSFPLSHYPMFTAKRSSTVKVTHLVGLDRAGGRHQVPYTYAGSGGLNQVRRQINRAVREGRAGALCDSVAARLARQEKGPLSEVVSVRLVIGKYGLAEYFAGKSHPVSEHVLASSEIERSPA